MKPINIPKPKLVRQTNDVFIPKYGTRWIEDTTKQSVIVVRIELVNDCYHVIYKYDTSHDNSKKDNSKKDNSKKDNSNIKLLNNEKNKQYRALLLDFHVDFTEASLIK